MIAFHFILYPFHLSFSFILYPYKQSGRERTKYTTKNRENQEKKQPAGPSSDGDYWALTPYPYSASPQKAGGPRRASQRPVGIRR
jgi:hypothetical protein